MTGFKQKISDYYEKHETKVDIAFFLGGFVFDVFTLSKIDDPLAILQQVAYLFVIGLILYYEFLFSCQLFQPGPRLQKVWNYRQLAVHFLLGSLLSVYSLFFLKSASFFSSLSFVLVIMVLMVLNELKSVQQSEVNIKVGLYIICVFSFFSMMVPVVLGFVGILPFLLAMALTGAFIYGVYRLLRRQVQDEKILLRKMVIPGSTVVLMSLVFYLVGWIPPVPLSVENMGIYHNIEKTNGAYILSHEKPWWKFWQTGDQTFRAAPGDKVYFFASVFSPGRFKDSVYVHWYFHDPRQGWKSTDRIPMQVTGGREKGFRGYAIKQNYSPGDWRVSVETTDRREIGRIYFSVETAEANPERVFQQVEL